jgi:hypothetical protein
MEAYNTGMDITGLIAVIMTFATPIIIVGLVVTGPKARAKAEIMKAAALAKIDDMKALYSAVDAEETNILIQDQQKRIEALEEDVRFMHKLLEDKTGR